MSDALTALGDLHASTDADLGYGERALLQVAVALLKLQQGDAADAKVKLSKALKLAHSKLQNHQLVSQILIFMAPIQVRVRHIYSLINMYLQY